MGLRCYGGRMLRGRDAVGLGHHAGCVLAALPPPRVSLGVCRQQDQQRSTRSGHTGSTLLSKCFASNLDQPQRCPILREKHQQEAYLVPSTRRICLLLSPTPVYLQHPLLCPRRKNNNRTLWVFVSSLFKQHRGSPKHRINAEFS